MAFLNVIRMTPPELGTCRADACRHPIEWVHTLNGKRMPVDHPLSVVGVVEHLDGTLVTVIDGAASHFSTCVAAKAFRKAR